MPEMLSSAIASRKQLDSCGRAVAAWKSVGEACVNHLVLMSSYVSRAALLMEGWVRQEQECVQVKSTHSSIYEPKIPQKNFR